MADVIYICPCIINFVVNVLIFCITNRILQCNKLCLAHVKRGDDLYENNNLLKWRDELQFHTFYIKLEYLMTLEYSNLMHDNI